MSKTAHCICINKLMMFYAGKWTDYEPKSNDTTIRIHYDQLLICTGLKVLESLSMNNKMKGIHKGDVLILIISNKDGVRKLKFQIKSQLCESLQILGQYFLVQNHDSKSKEGAPLKFFSLDNVLKSALENKDISTAELQTSGGFDNFVKLCLLDPTFGTFVQKTKEVIDKL